MSLYDYRLSREIAARDEPFYALIMAAMRRADDVNSIKLAEMFPETFAELTLRYNAAGGHLKDD